AGLPCHRLCLVFCTADRVTGELLFCSAPQNRRWFTTAWLNCTPPAKMLNIPRFTVATAMVIVLMFALSASAMHFSPSLRKPPADLRYNKNRHRRWQVEGKGGDNLSSCNTYPAALKIKYRYLLQKFR
ncbi:MAG: hypothetical protein R6V32_00210, partial [Bacteroidales bacterium]